MHGRKKILAAVVVCLALITGGILFYMDKAVSGAAEMYCYLPGDACFTEKGGFIYEGSHVSFMSPESGKRVLICNKAGCSHVSADCSAYFEESVCGISYSGDKLVYVTGGSSFDESSLYQSDMDGNNRKKICTMEHVQLVLRVQYFGEYALICYQNNLDENGNNLEEPEAGIVGYDFSKKSMFKVFSARNVSSLVSGCRLYDGMVYFFYTYCDLTRDDVLKHEKETNYVLEHTRSEIWNVPLEGGEAKKVVSGNIGAQCLPILKGNLIYVKEDGAYAYNLKKGTEKRVWEGGCELIPVFKEKDKVLIRAYESGQEGRKDYYQYAAGDRQAKRLCSSKMTLLAVMGEYAYYMDSEQKKGCCKKDDFLNGDVDEGKLFQDIYLEQLGE